MAPSFGYLLGFVLLAPAISLMTRRFNPGGRFLGAVGIGVLSMPVLFVPGVAYMKFLLNLPWREATLAGFAAFLVPDLLKILLSAYLASRLGRVEFQE